MRLILKPLQILYSIYALILFIVILIILMPFFFIASFFGKIKGGNIMFRLCSYWSDVWLPLIGIRRKLIDESKGNKIRPCIFVANHVSYLDIPMIVNVIREPVRPLGKAEMSKVPLFGFLYRNAVIMVQRNKSQNRSKSVAMLKRVLQKKVSICIFPEGTFNMTQAPLKDFYDGAFRIAIETQTPIQPIIFPDTINRLNPFSFFSLTPGLCRGVYLEEIIVDGMTAADLAPLKQLVFDRMKDALIRYRNK